MLLMQISGRVGADAEATRVNDQWAIRFPVCHSYQYTDANGNKKDVATWVRCTMWGKTDKMVQYIKKGNFVYVSGAPKAHGWLDNERKVRTQLELTVKDFEFVFSKKEDNTTNSSQQTQADNTTGSADNTSSFYNPPANTETPVNADDLPF